MQTTITIDDQQLKSLMLYTHSNNEPEAIYKAIQTYLQPAERQQDLLALRGEDHWQALRELEIKK